MKPSIITCAFYLTLLDWDWCTLTHDWTYLMVYCKTIPKNKRSFVCLNLVSVTVFYLLIYDVRLRIVVSCCMMCVWDSDDKSIFFSQKHDENNFYHNLLISLLHSSMVGIYSFYHLTLLINKYVVQDSVPWCHRLFYPIIISNNLSFLLGTKHNWVCWLDW